jgi:lauroyl/myristoyl acyltransferase
MRKVQPGIGSLAILASRSEVPVVPAAVYRAGGRFTISFACPLDINEDQTPEQLEDQLGRRIAEMLPAHARGAYAE